MTCGMLCVMRREGRGVLHLDKYSPPKAICSVEEEKNEKKNKEERQQKGKRTNSSLINK